ncbi:MAG: hypothetical protein AAF682_16180 [Planctomycetota bacterium]
MHYALLAELLGADTLCLGNERDGAARTLPPGDAFDGTDRELAAEQERRRLLQDAWLALIERMRGAFSGLLTYAAAPSREIEEVGFWPQLDLVGVDFFPKLPHPAGASSERNARAALRTQLARCVDVARVAERPLLLVQTGFPSHARAAQRATVPQGPVDVDAQLRLLTLLDEALDELRETAALAGLYLWSWNPDPRAGGAQHSGYTPQGKPAEAALPGLFE